MSGSIDTSLQCAAEPSQRLTESDAARRIKLQKAARDFESLFVYQLLRTMRASFTTSSDDENQMGFGKDVFMSIADEALSQKVGETGSFGIARKLLAYLDRTDRQVPDSDEPKKSGFHALSGKNAERKFKVLAEPTAPVKLKQDRTIAPAEKKLSREELKSVVESAAQKHGLSPKLISALIQVESAGDSTAVSRRGAKGLMQLTDSTASDMGVSDVFDPEKNVDAGSRYLKKLINRFSGDLKLALAAYNAGPAAVEKHGGVPPYPETERYVDKVIGIMSNTGE